MAVTVRRLRDPEFWAMAACLFAFALPVVALAVGLVVLTLLEHGVLR